MHFGTINSPITRKRITIKKNLKNSRECEYRLNEARVLCGSIKIRPINKEDWEK